MGPTRADDLEITPVPDGYVVYQRQRDRVHHLNTTAALVLELCTGDNDLGEIARTVQAAFSLEAPPLRETANCIRQLRDENLVTAEAEP